jgi:hypothetical protein
MTNPVDEPPPAEGVRMQWPEIPLHIREKFEAWSNSRVVAAESQPTGFSPGVAARLRLADGRELFTKAVTSAANEEARMMHRREARIVSALPDYLPVPRLRWFHDDEQSGWVMLVFDVARGHHPRQPWQSDELQIVLDGIAELAERLTPSPLLEGDVPSAASSVSRSVRGWQRLLADPPEVVQLLDDWSRRNLHVLADLESKAPQAVSGDTLLHFDLRADNVLLGDGHVWFFDWPHACVGAAWFDVLCFIPSVTMQGGPPPQDIFARYPASRAADSDAVTCGVATLAGYFTRQSLLPPPPGLPTLRAFQAAQGSVARRWLARRTGLV